MIIFCLYSGCVVSPVDDIDECWNIPCKNGGVCRDGYRSFTCVCPPGYTGPVCLTYLGEFGTVWPTKWFVKVCGSPKFRFGSDGFFCLDRFSVGSNIRTERRIGSTVHMKKFGSLHMGPKFPFDHRQMAYIVILSIQ